MSLNFKLKTIFAVVAILCTTSISFAQFSGGGRLGVNFANLRGSSVVDNSMLIGYNVGGFVNYSMSDLMSGDISEILSIQTEMTIQTKGAKAQYATLTPDSLTETSNMTQNFTYVEIPLIAKFTFTPGRGISYFGEGGFFLGALMGLSMDGEKSWDDDLDKETDPRKYRQEYSGFDAGIVIGGGASMPFGGRNSPWSAFANIRYALGLKNIGEEKDKTPEILKPYLEEVKTNTLSLVFGVTYVF